MKSHVLNIPIIVWKKTNNFHFCKRERKRGCLIWLFSLLEQLKIKQKLQQQFAGFFSSFFSYGFAQSLLLSPLSFRSLQLSKWITQSEMRTRLDTQTGISRGCWAGTVIWGQGQWRVPDTQQHQSRMIGQEQLCPHVHPSVHNAFSKNIADTPIEKLMAHQVAWKGLFRCASLLYKSTSICWSVCRSLGSLVCHAFVKIVKNG